jgi:hypothetical protein
MTPAATPLALNGQEAAIMAELLESERNRLLVQIRHADHRVYRAVLSARLKLVEELAQRFEHR